VLCTTWNNNNEALISYALQHGVQFKDAAFQMYGKETKKRSIRKSELSVGS